MFMFIQHFILKSWSLYYRLLTPFDELPYLFFFTLPFSSIEADILHLLALESAFRMRIPWPVDWESSGSETICKVRYQLFHTINIIPVSDFLRSSLALTTRLASTVSAPKIRPNSCLNKKNL
jgi:hypothetical protein